MDGLLNFFSRDAGQQRRASLEGALRGLLDDARYYAGPDVSRVAADVGGLLNMLNPVTSMEDSARASQNMLAPDRTPMQRVGDFGRMSSGVAAAVAPVVAGRMAGVSADDAANVMEGLIGWSPARQGMQDAGQRFVADQSGSIGFNSIKSRFPDVDVSISGSPSRGYTVNKIVVPESMRNQGIGSDVMAEIIRQADAQGVPVSLTPSKDFGGSVPKLRKFYERLGFVYNKGKNRDFSISEDMYRMPSRGLK